MILTINIENMQTVVGAMECEECIFAEKLSTDVSRTSTEYAMQIKNIFELHSKSIHSIEGAILSSVVPAITDTIKEAVLKLTGKQALVIGPGVKTGLNILTDHPAQVGSDMVAMAVAAIRAYETPIIILNFATATTMSVINDKNQYIGGIILPGLWMCAQALANEAAQLPQVSLEMPKKMIGKNTIDCMKSGLIYGTASCVDGMIQRVEEELGYPVKQVIATGEHMQHILPHCKRRMCANETLLLQGLYEIYQKNND